MATPPAGGTRIRPPSRAMRPAQNSTQSRALWGEASGPTRGPAHLPGNRLQCGGRGQDGPTIAPRPERPQRRRRERALRGTRPKPHRGQSVAAAALHTSCCPAPAPAPTGALDTLGETQPAGGARATGPPAEQRPGGRAATAPTQTVAGAHGDTPSRRRGPEGRGGVQGSDYRPPPIGGRPGCQAHAEHTHKHHP